MYALVTLSVMLSTTAGLLWFVRRVRGLNRQSVMTLVLIAIVYFISFTPYGLLVLFTNILSPGQLGSLWFVRFIRLAVVMPWFNFAANPIIYYLSIRSFGDFVRNAVRRRSMQTNSLNSQQRSQSNSQNVFSNKTKQSQVMQSP